jgi:hypothetical protein
MPTCATNRSRLLQRLSCTVLALIVASGARAQCCGDCNADGHVAIDELVTAANNALNECVLPFDVRQTCLGNTEVQDCTARLSAAGYTPGNVRAIGFDSFCDTARCEVSYLAIQAFGRDAEGRSLAALVTYNVSGGPDRFELVESPPFRGCDP